MKTNELGDYIATLHDSADFQRLERVWLGNRATLGPFLNLYGCNIGADTKLGSFIEIQEGAVVGRKCKISSHTFICSGVTIEDEVFIGHNVTFINDRAPRATNTEGELKTSDDWKLVPTHVCRGASIGSGATIVCGVRIGVGAVVGAGAVVTKDVPDGETWVGNPARRLFKPIPGMGT
jgi:UDP-2-acetamido-3-amino-2,3-dideoxy-glucuronate N-acetyltransferase